MTWRETVKGEYWKAGPFPAGETAAKKTGLPWWSPDSHGDANDFYLREGVRALGRELIYLIRDVTLRGRR